MANPENLGSMSGNGSARQEERYAKPSEVRLGEIAYNPFPPNDPASVLARGDFQDALKGMSFKKAIVYLLQLRDRRDNPPLPLSLEKNTDIDPVFKTYWEFGITTPECLTALAHMLHKGGFQHKQILGDFVFDALKSADRERIYGSVEKSNELLARIATVFDSVYGGPPTPPPFPADHPIYALMKGAFSQALGHDIGHAVKSLLEMRAQLVRGASVAITTSPHPLATDFFQREPDDPQWAIALCGMLHEAGFTDKRVVMGELQNVFHDDSRVYFTIQKNIIEALDAIYNEHKKH